MPGLHKGVSTQHTNQQVLAKPRHQPSERDQQARERLRQKAKIKSRAYVASGGPPGDPGGSCSRLCGHFRQFHVNALWTHHF